MSQPTQDSDKLPLPSARLLFFLVSMGAMTLLSAPENMLGPNAIPPRD